MRVIQGFSKAEWRYIQAFIEAVYRGFHRPVVRGNEVTRIFCRGEELL